MEKACSISHQLLVISIHNQLSIEQTQCIFKQAHSFAQNGPIKKKLLIQKSE